MTTFFDEPVFCFTSDLDWAPEWAISEWLQFLDGEKLSLTPFLTHHSNLIHKKFNSAEMTRRVGLHPNFLSSSTHGKTPIEIIDNVQKLWPSSVFFRSHSFFDNTYITEEFRRRGFKFDSNLCLLFHANCVPLKHNSGMLRFPVFWEDDYRLREHLPFDETDEFFSSPGLKILNVHPFHFAVNTPNLDFYAAHRHLYNLGDEQWRSQAHSGNGTRTLVEAVVKRVQANSYRTAYLYDLYLEYSSGHNAQQLYESMSIKERTECVRARYDDRNGLQPYSTSRDFNLKELEIGFIRSHLPTGRILDIGCGNGYTLLSLAQQCESSFIGLDFSDNMVDSARKLMSNTKGLKSTPEFRVSDVRHLPFEDESFDCIISERCLLNLPSRKDQYDTIREVHRVLKHGGAYLMIEGSEDGLSRLNDLRVKVGLPTIPSISPSNPAALKFKEAELDPFLHRLFNIEVTQFFGTYYLISRVVHPLLVQPEEPRFDAKINEVARHIAEVLPDVAKLGHIKAYKLVKH